jgi:hypothetical protein
MKQWLLLAGFWGLGAMAASAQVRFGPEVGMSLNNYVYKLGGDNISNKLKAGVRAGVVADVKLVEGFYLQAGLQYVSKGMVMSGNYGLYKNNIQFKGTETVHYLEIPAYIVAKTGTEESRYRFLGMIGPYAAITMGGKFENSTGTAKLRIGNKAFADDMKPLDLGINFGAGIEFQNTLFMKLTSGIGLTNMQPGGNPDNALRNRNISLTFGYLFG